MDVKWLTDDLAEVSGAISETSARTHIERTTGRIVERVIHVAFTIYQVQVR